MKPIINNNGKVVGNIKEGVFRKAVQSSRHLMKALNAWGIDKEHLNEDFSEIRILDKDTDKVYVASKDSFMSLGIRRNFGHGDQIFLPIKYFSIVDRKQKQLI